MSPEKKLTAGELHDLYFQLEFCEPKDKLERQKIWDQALKQAVEQTGVPRYTLELALLKTYPQYRAKRLGKELPDLPLKIRGD